MGHVAKDAASGAWLARWRDPSGRQRKKSFRRKVDAERFLAGLAADMNRGAYIDPLAGKVLVGAYAERWLSGLSHLKDSTAERYREIVRRHIIPTWGTWQLAKISRSDVTSWLGRLSAEGLSAGTIRKVYLVLSMMLDAAVADSRIARNPAKGVPLPRQARKEPRFLSADDLGRLITAAGGDGLHIAVLGLTGLRFGEFAALRVGKLDPVRHRLTVSQSVSVVGSQMVWTTPKTHRTRSVPVPPALTARLVDAAGGRDRNDLLFPAPMGGPIRLNNWRRRVFAPACEAAGITGATPHDLRHTAASLAIAAGANVKAVQQMLGHASAAMTLDVYAGLFPDDLDAVGRSLDGLVPEMCHLGGVDVEKQDAPASTRAENRGKR